MSIKKLLAATAALSAGLSIGTPAHADSAPLIGEIISVGFTFCPRGFVEADGQILPINTNQALFSLYGTQFGGNGQTDFALPDLRSREAIGESIDSGIGDIGGSVQMTISLSALPAHTHTGQLRAVNTPGNSPAPQRRSLAVAPTGSPVYSSNDPTNNMNVGDLNILPAGSGLPIQKRSPMLAMTQCVAVQGQFPSRN